MVAYMMAAKFMHVNLRSIISTSNAPSTAEASGTTTIAPASPVSPATNLARTSAERSTINNSNQTYTQTLPPIISKNEQLPSPPTSPKAYSDSDPLNYHYFQSPNKKSTTNNATIPPINHNERHFQILRMELEFLHFLNYNLSLADTLKLVHWAQNFDDDSLSSHYTSGDEGGDEWDTENH